MGAQAHQVEMAGIRLAVDQNQIGPDVAVAVIFPRPGQGMIVTALRQSTVGRQVGHDGPDLLGRVLANRPLFSRL